jgi:Polyketide cyclase / dehydrase and lipid transport
MEMARIDGEIVIAAPLEQVFDTVADERNEPRYNPRIVRAEKTSEGPVGSGARFIAEPKGMGTKWVMTVPAVDASQARTGSTVEPTLRHFAETPRTRPAEESKAVKRSASDQQGNIVELMGLEPTIPCLQSSRR